MKVFINRTLNMKKIKAIGFDMDHTIVRYHTEAFEELAYHSVIKKLIELKNYPESLKQLKFDFNRVIQGLVLDTLSGNILKLNRFGKVKTAYHGLRRLSYNEQQELYLNREIWLSDKHIESLDTSFSVSQGVLFSQLVDLKDKGEPLPNYENIDQDIRQMIDLSHRDGTLKDEVKNNIEKYIIPDPELPPLLENYKAHGKKLMIITNSDFNYTKLLMDYAFAPYLKEHKSWMDLFDVTITLAFKPQFFTGKSIFLRIDPETSLMSNIPSSEKILKGVYQGGHAAKLQADMGLFPSEILYIGDHIYGDVVSLKKSFNWRTALVFSPLETEVASIISARSLQVEIDKMMEDKNVLEDKIQHIYREKDKHHKKIDKNELNNLYNEMDKINTLISNKLEEYHQHFNPYWGEQMRSGNEESQLAGQVEKYSCIYMAKVVDLLNNSPRSYFRPFRRTLPHERV